MTRPQHFGWFLARGFGPQGWGYPSLDWDYDWTRPEIYQEAARTLEQAGFDLVIIEDGPSLGSASTIDLRVRHASAARSTIHCCSRPTCSRPRRTSASSPPSTQPHRRPSPRRGSSPLCSTSAATVSD